jgi:protoporphyrin/coproporphyrin ferrochelatase
MAQKLADRLPEDWEKKVCYQSRVGPLKWIGPATEDVIKDVALENRHMLVAPIAFVSDHIETLVELGEEYREIAEDAGAPGYTTVPALGTDAGFISALSDELIATLEDGRAVRSCAGGRLCPTGFGDCPISEAPQ